MTFIESIQTCFKKSFEIKGRASKPEFWWFFLFYLSVFFILLLINETLGIIFFIIIIPASICVTVRRLHDQDYSGWFYFITLIPYVGGIILLIMCALDGTKGKNRFGPQPKIKNISKRRNR